MVEPDRSDRRFRDPAWDDHAVFDFIKQSYLLTSRWLVDTVNGLEGFDDKTRQKIDFYTRQFVDALAPSNFVATNPEVLRATLESRGANLLHGLNHLLEDLARGEGRLAIRMTDLEAFELGKNLALTPGKVDLSERPAPADPICPEHRGSLSAAAVDHPALDQQVLHLGSAAQEQLRQIRGRSGFHGIRGLLGQSGRAPRRQDLRGLHGRRRACRARCDRAGDRRARDDRDRLLPRRHAACLHSGLPRRQARPARSRRRASSRR